MRFPLFQAAHRVVVACFVVEECYLVWGLEVWAFLLVALHLGIGPCETPAHRLLWNATVVGIVHASVRELC